MGLPGTLLVQVLTHRLNRAALALLDSWQHSLIRFGSGIGGAQQGEAQGNARVIAAQAAAVTLRQLNRRCGPLSAATTARI